VLLVVHDGYFYFFIGIAFLSDGISSLAMKNSIAGKILFENERGTLEDRHHVTLTDAGASSASSSPPQITTI